MRSGNSGGKKRIKLIIRIYLDSTIEHKAGNAKSFALCLFFVSVIIISGGLDMFFFFFNFGDFEVIKTCLNQYVKEQIKSKNYCDISELFSESITKKYIIENIAVYSNELAELYRRKYPDNIDDLHIISELYYEKASNGMVTDSEAFAVLFWSFKVFKRKKSFEKNKAEIMEELMSFIQNDLFEKRYSYFDSIVFDNTNVIVYKVDTVSDYLNILKKNNNNEVDMYFRGHSKTTYNLKPSILRTEKIKKNEKEIYQELLINCPNDFREYKNHIDYLVKMQHYGAPTRLLDITRNPLVALYFSCCSNFDSIGEIIIFSPKKTQIKYENSDTVAMIASLPLFSYEEQITLMDNLYVSQNDNSNIIERFIHEIQTEKPGFINRINRSDLENCFIVFAKKDNSRIVKQDGAFIICGMNENPEKMINQNLRLCHKDKPVLVFVTNKREILKELDLLSINKSTLFPEIDYVSEYIKLKYSE